MAQKDSSSIPYKNWPNDAGFEATAEQREPNQLPVTGLFPSQLAGTLYRTGPGTYKVPGSKYELSHWFDGFTQLHRFQLVAQTDGTCTVLYNSRRQVDPLIEKARQSGTLEGITFGQKRDPCATIFQKLKSVFQPALNTKDPGLANVGVTVHANTPGAPKFPDSQAGLACFRSLTCLSDSGVAKHINPETLEPLGVTRQDSLHPDLKGPLSGAHAQFDPVSGDLYNYNLDLGRQVTYRIFRTSAATGKTEIIATISGPIVKPAYIHSFFISEDYVILCIWPSVFAANGARILWERNLVDAMKFDSNLQSRWYVVDTKQGRGVVATFLSPAFFSFHTINAWQEDNGNSVDIMCDIIQYPNDDTIRKTYYENMVSTGSGAGRYFGGPDSHPSLVRYRLAGIPKTGRLTASSDDLPKAEPVVSIRDQCVGDLPTINPKFATRKSRYVYNAIGRDLSSFFDGLARVDLETKETKIWSHEKHTPGEAIFVPDGTGNAEDAGYLLTVVLNGETGTSYLLCLNARDMTEVGRADVGMAVGFGFHGSHYPPASR